MKKTKKYNCPPVKIPVCLACFLIFFAFAQIHKAERFHYDSHGYWALSHSFTEAGETGWDIGRSPGETPPFSLNGFPQSIRGYAFPFVLYLLRSLFCLFGFTEQGALGVFAPAAFTLAFAVLLPRFLKALCGVNVSGRRLAAFVLLINIFWWGYLVYPLSDLWSCAMLIACAAALFKTAKSESLKGALPFAFAAGVLAYAAYNTRLANIVSLWLIFVFTLVCAFGKTGLTLRQISVRRVKKLQITGGGEESAYNRFFRFGPRLSRPAPGLHKLQALRRDNPSR